MARSTNDLVASQLLSIRLGWQGQPYFHGVNPARYLLDDGDGLRFPMYQFVLVRPSDLFWPSAADFAWNWGATDEESRSARIDLVVRFVAYSRPSIVSCASPSRPTACTRGDLTLAPIEPACLARPKANCPRPDAPGNVARGSG